MCLDAVSELLPPIHSTPVLIVGLASLISAHTGTHGASDEFGLRVVMRPGGRGRERRRAMLPG